MFSYENPLVKINVQAILVENGVTINPKPVLNNTTEVEIAAMLTKVKTVFKTLHNFLFFFYFFLIFDFHL